MTIQCAGGITLLFGLKISTCSFKQLPKRVDVLQNTGVKFHTSLYLSICPSSPLNPAYRGLKSGTCNHQLQAWNQFSQPWNEPSHIRNQPLKAWNQSPQAWIQPSQSRYQPSRAVSSLKGQKSALSSLTSATSGPISVPASLKSALLAPRYDISPHIPEIRPCKPENNPNKPEISL